MSGRKPLNTENSADLLKKSFRVDETETPFGVEQAVCDETSHDKLDAIIGALGGSADTTTNLYNVNIISAGVEQSQSLPSNTKTFLIRSRNKGRLRLAYTLGGTDTTYLTIPTGSSYVDDQFRTTVTLYFQSNKPGDVIEIVAFS